MSIQNEELLQFIEYIEDKDLQFSININSTNQIESSLVWYELIERDLIRTYYIFNPNTQMVLRWNGIDLNCPLDLFLKNMRQFEHIFCIKAMKENYQGDEECFTFFDYAKEEWIKKVKIFNSTGELEI